MKLTSPANNQGYPSGTSIPATAGWLSGTAPYTVNFFTRSLPGGTLPKRVRFDDLALHGESWDIE